MWNDANGGDGNPGLDDHYGMRREPGFMDGLGRLVLEPPNDMLDRVVAIVDAYANFLFHWWEDGGVTSIDNGVPLCSYRSRRRST